MGSSHFLLEVQLSQLIERLHATDRSMGKALDSQLPAQVGKILMQDSDLQLQEVQSYGHQAYQSILLPSLRMFLDWDEISSESCGKYEPSSMEENLHVH